MHWLARKLRFALAPNACGSAWIALALALLTTSPLRADEPLPTKPTTTTTRDALNRDALATEFAGPVRELASRYCISCHSAEQRAGELDLERFAAYADLARDPYVWVRVAEMLDNGEMPPEEAEQPTPLERTELRQWVQRFLDAEALARAGDPGPVLLRRLNNAEYTYTIRDLTQIALDPAREFPSDSAAGEGFTNTGNSLVMSPALLTKYLDAAKSIAAHAELLPQGFRFSPATTRADWTNLALGRIRALYGSISVAGSAATTPNAPLPAPLQGIGFDASQGMRLPFENYLAALAENRAALDAHRVSLSAIADERGLNAQYLGLIWKTLHQASPSPIGGELNALWQQAAASNDNKTTNRATSETSVGKAVPGAIDGGSLQPLVRRISQWQRALWQFANVGHITTKAGPQTWQQPVSPLATRQDFRIALPPAAEDGAVTLYLVCRDAGDGGSEDVAVWRQPRLSAPGRPDLPLAELRTFYGEMTARRAEMLGATAEALRAAADAEQALFAQDTVEQQTPIQPIDVESLAERVDAHPEAIAAWFEFLGIGSSAADRLDRMTEKRIDVAGRAAASGWGPEQGPHVTANSSAEEIRYPGVLRPHGVCVLPSDEAFAGIAWQAPVAGLLGLEAQVTRANVECGDGIGWELELRRGATRQSLASGVANGREPVVIGPLVDVAVQQADVLALLIGPQSNDHACDYADVQWTITSSNGLRWNLTQDVSHDILASNPRADRHGNREAWHFFQEEIRLRATQTMTPPGSLLARWQGARSRSEKERLASELESLLVFGPAKEQEESSPDHALYRQLARIGGPLSLRAWSRIVAGTGDNDAAKSAEAGASGKASLGGASHATYGLPPGAFGPHARDARVAPHDLCVGAPSILEVRLPKDLAEGAEFVASGELSTSSGGEASVQMEVSTRPPEDARLNPAASIVVAEGSPARQRFQKAFDDFRQLFPIALCYTKIVPIDEVVTLTLFHREDEPLSRLMMNEDERRQLERLWREFRFISQDALLMTAAYEQLGEFATQDRPEIVVALKPLKKSIDDAAAAFRQTLIEAEPHQLDALVEFAESAYRRPLSEADQTRLRSLYAALRSEQLGHDEAFRLTLARILASADFLYRLERAPEGTDAAEVTPWELANRLSYFLWSSQPDEPLRFAARQGTLTQSDELKRQARRMTSDPRIRRLATEFACQWLHIYEFDLSDEKSERHFPEFAEIRGAMYEEAIEWFADLFQRDGSLLEILEADHVFLNEKLAQFYAIPGVEGDHWRRVDNATRYGRGGVLALGAVLSKQSGASRTSPILRGNWLSEALLGEKLPRPPKNVPPLPDDEQQTDALSVREMVARHTSDPKCSSCHQKIDPFGFALEEYDAIGRRRSVDAGGRSIDPRATLPDGTEVDGLPGLRRYLAVQRRDDVLRQFTRKLLGYALGRATRLSDEPLLNDIERKLAENDYRFSAALETIIVSEPFRKIRGSAFQ